MAITSLELKRQILASKVSHVRSLNLEKALEYDLNSFFKRLKEQVLHELTEYWPETEGVLLQGQLNLILAPIFESQQEYYNILREYNIKEYDAGYKQGRRLVNLARKPLSSLKSESSTIKVNKLANLKVDKDELFGTNDWTQQKLLDQSFTASERTINRVDSDINKIISDGYASGAGINKVAADIEHRFQQLQTWESQRIARTEIHNAHQMGIMNIYQEMGVQYIQWTSAHDSRVRGLKPKDKADHVKIDGEIIPLGGTFSNGLQYPGDTKGPIYEWINCRCGNVPFIIPDGFIAPPGMAQFRESDLVQTLDYWNQNELITTVTEERGLRQAELYGVPIKESLIKNQFAVPTEDLSEFGISNDGLKTIQQIQKRNFGEHKEFGFRFDEKTGKILSDEFEGTGKYVDIPPSKSGNYSTIHNHTYDSLSAPSADDFYTYFTRKRETVAVNVSRNDTWIIKIDRNVFNYKKVETICQNVYDVEVRQIQKLKKEYRILKNEVKQGKITQRKLDEYLANDFIKKHNSELEKNLLDVLSDVKGLKVKRIVNNTKINPESIPKLQNIKTVKPNGKSKGIRKAPEIKKDPKKVVEYNGKKVYGVEESDYARTAFEIKFGILKEELTKEEYKFIKLYSGNGFSILNSYLREISNINNPKLIRKIKRKYALKWAKLIFYHPRQYMSFDKSLNVLSDIFKKGKVLEEDLVVVRRQKGPMTKYANNRIYHSDACLSTSISENVKPEEYGDYVNYIVIPKGTRILYIEGITATRWEYEVLLDKNIDLELIREESEHLAHWKLL